MSKPKPRTRLTAKQIQDDIDFYNPLKSLPPEKLAFLDPGMDVITALFEEAIVFKKMVDGEIDHTVVLDTAGIADYRSVIAYFVQTVMKDLKLFSGYDVLYPKVKSFVQNELFGQTVELESPNTIRNLSEVVSTKTVLDSFKKAINELTVCDKGDGGNQRFYQA